MAEEFITYLPPEIVINILSRLPVRTVTSSKCVCKPWLHLIESQEFVKSHLSKSVPGLVIDPCEPWGKTYSVIKIFDIEETIENLKPHKHRYNKITEIKFPADPLSCIMIQVSANGLLFLCDLNIGTDDLYICNPMTREYVKLLNLEWMAYDYPTVVTNGFGVTKMSGEYKVVWIMHKCVRDPDDHSLMSIPKSECRIYTLGTGSWLSITPGPGDTFEYNCHSIGVFLNGNLHWLVRDLKGSYFISCLNLEAEDFSSLSTPTPTPKDGQFHGGRVNFVGFGIANLDGCLCFCDNTSDVEIVIWVIKEYGEDNSWVKEFVITKIPNFVGKYNNAVYPLKVFGDGDILMFWEGVLLFYYCNKTKVAMKVDVVELENGRGLEAMLHTSSFVSLKSFVIENVKSF